MEKVGFWKWMLSDWKTWAILSIAGLIGVSSYINGVFILTAFMAAIVVSLLIGNYIYWSKNLK
jgi:hypothetical protein